VIFGFYILALITETYSNNTSQDITVGREETMHLYVVLLTSHDC